MVSDTDGESESETRISTLAKKVAAELQDALVAAHYPDTEALTEALARMSEALSSARQRVMDETVGQSGQARRDALRKTMREAMVEWGHVHVATMGAGFLNLIDVGAVAHVVLVAFTWPPTGSRRYCFAESITELSEDWNEDVPSIVASIITNIDETIAGGGWLEHHEFAKLHDFHIIQPSWQGGP